jgi:large subunit ribosomal protein L17
VPKPKKAGRFGSNPEHHKAIMANLATELFRHERITTTHAKAKTMQSLAERMVTHARRGDVSSRRQAMRVITDPDVVHKLFAEIGPACADRNGGYTRVLKLGPRAGDGAEMALVELVDEVGGEQTAGEEGSRRRRWGLRRRGRGESTGGSDELDLDDEEFGSDEEELDETGEAPPSDGEQLGHGDAEDAAPEGVAQDAGDAEDGDNDGAADEEPR